jgi:hypothetical protein
MQDERITGLDAGSRVGPRVLLILHPFETALSLISTRGLVREHSKAVQAENTSHSSIM